MDKLIKLPQSPLKGLLNTLLRKFEFKKNSTYVYFMYFFKDFNNFVNIFLVTCKTFYFNIKVLFINYKFSINFMLVTLILSKYRKLNLIFNNKKKVIVVLKMLDLKKKTSIILISNLIFFT